MNRTFFTIICLLFSLGIYSQNETIKHIIDRGETLSSIAKKYDVSTTEIVDSNPDISGDFYVGMELNIPRKTTYSNKKSSSFSKTMNGVVVSTQQVEQPSHLEIADRECKDADRLLEDGRYSKAIKAYTQIIKKYNSNNVDAYYGRGIAYYNTGKWKKAIGDFEYVTAISDCDESIHSHCIKLLADARKNRQAQLEQRGEMWGSLLAAAAVTTTSVIISSQQAKSSANINTISQSNYGALGTTTSGSIGSESEMNSGSSKTNKNCPSLKAANGKWYCANTGRCGMCGGDGFMDGSFGQGANSAKCTLCGGSGKCKYCQ